MKKNSFNVEHYACYGPGDGLFDWMHLLLLLGFIFLGGAVYSSVPGLGGFLIVFGCVAPVFFRLLSKRGLRVDAADNIVEKNPNALLPFMKKRLPLDRVTKITMYHHRVLVSIAVNPYDVPNMFMPNYIVWQFSTAEKEDALVVSFSNKQDMKPIVAMIQGEIAKSGRSIELAEEDRRPDDLKQKYPLTKIIP